MTRISPRMLISGFVVSTVVITVGACDSPSDPAPGSAAPPAPTVSVLAVDTKPFSASIDFIGRTEAFSLVELRARVTGFLLEQRFEEGSDVKKGDLLYQIDTSEFDTATAAAKAGLERAEAAATEADQKLNRSKTLADRGTVSEASLDEAIAAMGKASADVAAAKADLDRARLDLDYTRIVSPLDGRIGSSSVDKGNLIGPDSGVLATIVALDPIRVVFSISERTYIEVQKSRQDGSAPQMVPRIRLANGSLYEQSGMFRFADNRVDPSTGTVSVYVDFPNPDHLLLPGQFVTVILSNKEAADLILIPQAAVQLNQAGPFVLLVDKDSKVEMRPVRTGERSGTEIVVEDGLVVGETVIVSGIQKVRPGLQVETSSVPQNTSDK